MTAPFAALLSLQRLVFTSESGSGWPDGVFAYPIDELGKVADLVESVPDGQLEFTFRRSGRKHDSDFDEVLFWG